MEESQKSSPIARAIRHVRQPEQRGPVAVVPAADWLANL